MPRCRSAAPNAAFVLAVCWSCVVPRTRQRDVLLGWREHSSSRHGEARGQKVVCFDVMMYTTILRSAMQKCVLIFRCVFVYRTSHEPAHRLGCFCCSRIIRTYVVSLFIRSVYPTHIMHTNTLYYYTTIYTIYTWKYPNNYTSRSQSPEQ